MRIKTMTAKGLPWLAELEGGYRLSAYKDSGGIWTISAGLTTLSTNGGERRVRAGDRFASLNMAAEAFRKRVARDEAAIDAATRDDITPEAFDAFVSARYNIGPAFDRSTTLKRYNAREPIFQVAQALRMWRFADGQPSAGLDERRACEVDLLLRGIYRLQGERR